MSFIATLADSGETFPLLDGKSILESALAAGRRFPFGCRSGTCGSCKGRVLAGTVDLGPVELRPALSAAEERDGYALFCRAQAESDLTLKVRELGGTGDPVVKTLPARVVGLNRLAPDVMQLRLALPKTESLDFRPGQYIEFLLKDGKPRAFSLANTPEEGGTLELHIRHYPGGTFSGYVFNELKENALLRLRGPLGQFYLRADSTRPLIFIAGGTGFAPIKGIIEQLLAAGLTRPATLYWGARARADLYLHDLAQSWAPAVRFVPVLVDPAAEDHWQGERGFVHEVVARDITDAAGLDAYASGPPPMVRAVREVLLERGLDVDAFYSDSFESAAP
jgi:CDP-4-dehydro-6-deoxyglucose reductase, E3